MSWGEQNLILFSADLIMLTISETWDAKAPTNAFEESNDWTGAAPPAIDRVQDSFSQMHLNSQNAEDNNAAAHDDGGGGGYAAGSGGACRICGQEGHFARECPEKPQGDETCRVCNQVGHFARDCPDKTAPGPCRNCGEEGHRAIECEAPRQIHYEDVQDMTSDQAWDLMRAASRERDIDDFKHGIRAYMKSNRALTFADVESRCREEKFSIYLIALEKELPKSMTSVSPQGKSGCKFVIGYYFSNRPRRAKFAEGWPQSPEENLERLKAETGMPMEHVLPLCRRCNELGHIAKSCPEPRQEVEQQQNICFGCGQAGHRLRDCPEPRKPRGGTMECRNCGGPHKAADCTEPRSLSNVECRVCNETGHMAKDCPEKQEREPRACRNCGSIEHLARDCDQPRNMDLMICRNCEKPGHISRDCPEETDWSKVQCRNCSEFGHTIKRCKQPINDENGFGSGYGAGDSGGDAFDTAAAGGANVSGWAATPAGGNDWDVPGASAGGW